MAGTSGSRGSSATTELPTPRIERVGQRRQVLRAALAQRHQVLEPHAEADPGIVEPRLEGEDVAAAEDPFLAGMAAERGVLVQLETDPVAEAVDIAARRARIGDRRRPAMCLEPRTGGLLERPAAGADD